MTAPTVAAPNSEDWWGSIRTCLAVLLLLLYAGASTVRWLNEARDWPDSSAQDEISGYERRFEPLKSVLPSHGVVGYLGHPDPATASPDDVPATAHLHFRRFLLAQYALAPVLLVDSTEPELVVGNFDPGPAPAPPAGFRVAWESGHGLVLFRRSVP
jgi:hypothetical protein